MTTTRWDPSKDLDLPLRWIKTRHTEITTDLFRDDVADELIVRALAVMAQANHTFQIRTKRHGRMRTMLSDQFFRAAVRTKMSAESRPAAGTLEWPLPNVWLGVSIEDQEQADLRIPALLDTPAAVRWISAEPLLGPVDLTNVAGVDALEPDWMGGPGGGTGAPHPLLDWVVVGGESGPGARPMHPDWARTLRDQCVSAGIPYFFKQWGAYRWVSGDRYNAETQCWVDDGIVPQRVSKKLSGRELDGREWSEFPVAAQAVNA